MQSKQKLAIGITQENGSIDTENFNRNLIPYLKKLYWEDEAEHPKLLELSKKEFSTEGKDFIQSDDEMRAIIKKLCRDKATGIDQLPDRFFKKLKKHDVLRKSLNKLFQKAEWPSYLYTARIIPLSKTDSAYPSSYA